MSNSFCELHTLSSNSSMRMLEVHASEPSEPNISLHRAIKTKRLDWLDAMRYRIVVSHTNFVQSRMYTFELA